MIRRIAFSLLAGGIVVALVLGCSRDSSSSAAAGPTGMTPPESIVGTFALSDDSSGVYEFDFESTPSGSGLRGSVHHTASGKVRYASQDFTAAGYFENSDGSINITAELSGAGSFVVAGSYIEDEEFTGTIQYYDSNGTLLAEGTATGAAGSDGSETTVLYTGTYGGDSWGVWNGTLSGTVFVGTYSGDGDSGPLYMTRSGDTLEMNISHPEGGALLAEGTLSSDGGTISGWWEDTEYEDGAPIVDRGTWTGAKVEGDYDPNLPSSDDDPAFLANVISQTIENGMTGWDEAYEDTGNPSVSFAGASGSVTAGGSLIPSAVLPDNIVYAFNTYRDAQTEITVAGYVYTEPTMDTEGEELIALGMVIDSDNNWYIDGTGMALTYPGDSTPSHHLFVDATVDWQDGTITSFQSGTAVWVLSPNNTYDDGDDIDVLPHMEAVLFGN